MASNATKTVGSLLPAHAIIIPDSANLYQSIKLMVLKNVDCLLAVDGEGGLSGIITDKDIVYKAVSEDLDFTQTLVSQIMTRDPIAVYDNGSRNEALNIMVSRRIRHLPVIFDEENYIGLLDLTKCVYDRIEELEHKILEAQSLNSTIDLLERTGAVATTHAKLLKHSIPDVQYVLKCANEQYEHGAEVPIVTPNSTIIECARTMRAARVAGVISVDGTAENPQLNGLITTKDIVRKVMHPRLSPSATTVTQVMTHKPCAIAPETKIVDALKILRDGNFNHAPVMEGSSAAGLVDVLSLTVAMLKYLIDTDLDGSETNAWNRILDAPAAPSNKPLGSRATTVESIAKLNRLKEFMGESLVDNTGDLPIAKMLKGLDIAIRLFEFDEEQGAVVLAALRAKREEIANLQIGSQDLL